MSTNVRFDRRFPLFKHLMVSSFKKSPELSHKTFKAFSGILLKVVVSFVVKKLNFL